MLLCYAIIALKYFIILQINLFTFETTDAKSRLTTIKDDAKEENSSNNDLCKKVLSSFHTG